MFQTIQSRVAIVLSGAWVAGSILSIENDDDLPLTIGVGLAAIWGGIYGLRWILQAPGAATTAGDASGGLANKFYDWPQWAGYTVLILLAAVVMGLSKVISRAIAGY